MRWIVISLLLFNLAFFLKNWLEFSHARSLAAMNAEVLGIAVGEMPGMRLTLLSERKSTIMPREAALRQKLNGVLATENISEVKNDSIQVKGQDTPDAALAEMLNTESLESEACILLGPYSNNGSARELIGQLAALQIESKYASIRIAGEPDYWVYLIPEPTRELATVKLRELQEKKIDSFLIPQGDIANGISLGVFDRRENAEKHQQTILSLGYDAKLRSNPRNYLENWVVIYPSHAAKLTSDVYERIHSGSYKPDLRKEQCNKVASIIDIH
jgi:hypothetical protein